ncbi:calcium-binding protein [Phenylobacterium sp.]|uniref:calcium-binding protein n=1 Tax=Phenylobacterium sp. TaxID=1871053 RepID=UPI0035AF2ACE
MATYSFATITPEEARRFNILDYDTLVFPSGSARQVVVQYAPQSDGFGVYRLTLGARTVEFPQAGAFFGLPAAAEAGRLRFSDGSSLFIGSDRADTFAPTGVQATRPLALYGGEGNDELSGGTRDDVLQGNQGADSLYGGEGDDLIYGGQGDDLLAGDDGADTLQGNLGADTLDGGAGRDVLYGGQGDDVLAGGDDADLLFGDLGADTLNGDDGDDRLTGGAGDDLLVGGRGADTLIGDQGRDLLRGGAGVDSLNGGAGDDTVEGGSGADLLRGGSGGDLFLFAPTDSTVAAPDIIFDFDEDDTLDFRGLTAATPLNFRLLTPAADATVALARAQAALTTTTALTYVAVPVGEDIYLYVDSFGVDQAFSLVILRDASFFSPFTAII